MTQKQQREYYLEYVKNIVNKLGISKAEFDSFKKWGQTLRGIYERQCNGYLLKPELRDWDKVSEKRDEKLELDYNKVVMNQAKKLGLYVYFQTDPRGATIYLSREPIPENNYTVASCIY
jgi:hypothetical protein